MKLHRLLTSLMVLFLSACGSFKVDAVPTPVPSPLPDCKSLAPDPNYSHLCQMEVVSPDQQHRWHQECEDLGMELRCQILFPNGQKSAKHDWSLKWSPTSTYALVPIGGNHDTPPGGYELWNMLTATRLGVLEPTSPWMSRLEWVEWAPDGLSVLYLKHGFPDRRSIVLAQIDAATGAESVMRQCPDWLLATLWSADDYRHWILYCDNVRMPPDVPAILSFAVEPKTTKPGESITLRWTSQGGTVATLQHNVAGTMGDEIRVPVSGTLSMLSGRAQYGSYMFILRLTNESSQTDKDTVSLPIK